jgi:hypothetical protein
VRRSANALVDMLTNKGVGKDSPKLDDTWINILDGQLRTDCNHLAVKDCEDKLSMESHIKEDIARPRGSYASPG